MRRIITISLAAILAVSAWAVPVKKGIKKMVTVGGKEITLTLTGDEHGHYWKSEAGDCYIEDDGVFSIINKSDILGNASARRQKIAGSSRMAKTRAASTRSYPTTLYSGNKKGLIILAQFSDKKFLSSHDSLFYTRVANETGFENAEGFVGSVSDYFLAQSNGNFELTFDVIGPVTLEHPYSYYGKNNSYGNDSQPELMIYEACKAIDGYVDFSQYDWDGDKYVDEVFVIYAGYGEADGGSSNTIWPHMWNLSASTNVGPIRTDGVVIDTYACSNELKYDTNQSSGLGTLCHEFSHCLGLVDHYDLNGQNYGTAYWDLMDYGSYLGDGFIPCGYTALERYTVGWLDPVVLDSDTTISGMKSLADNGEAYIIYNDNNRNEFYMLENRQKKGWDSELYGKGLIITHIDFKYDVWLNNEVNTTYDTSSGNDHQRYYVVPADNSTSYTRSNYAGDAYPYKTNDSISSSSKPAATIYNTGSDGSEYLNKSVFDISIAADSTVSFTFVNAGDRVKEDTLVIDTENAIFYESFDKCSSTGGNDGSFSGAGVGSGDFLPDHETGWSGTTTGSSDDSSLLAYGADRCARFGNSKKAGAIITPAITLDGEAKLYFKAAPWGSDGKSLSVNISGGTIGETSYTMKKDQWTQYSTTITGTGSIRLSFTASKRFFLDEIVIVENSESGIREIKAGKASDGKIYNLSGQFVGTDTSVLPSGIYIIDGKKYMKK